jgi:hypothetical protein
MAGNEKHRVPGIFIAGGSNGKPRIEVTAGTATGDREAQRSSFRGILVRHGCNGFENTKCVGTQTVHACRNVVKTVSPLYGKSSRSMTGALILLTPFCVMR